MFLMQRSLGILAATDELTGRELAAERQRRLVQRGPRRRDISEMPPGLKGQIYDLPETELAL